MSLPYIVLQYNDLQQLNFIQQGSTRLKVSCFDLCPSLIVLGANSGTIYILDHDSLKLKHQLPTGNGSVVQLSISPDESHVAYALSNGSVEVFEILSQDGSGCRHMIGSREHEGQIVSSIVWSQNGLEVYIGDAAGRVSVLYVPKSRTASLFRSSCIHLMTMDCAVTQLDYRDGHLLVSTLDRSYICNTSFETFAQIGTKLRNGEFGGCFCRVNLASSVTGSSQHVKIAQHEQDESLVDNQKPNNDSGKLELSDCYEATEEKNEKVQLPPERAISYSQQSVVSHLFCARPGSRVWEGDLSGKVLVTHQLKKALMVPPIDTLLIDGSYGNMELLRKDAMKLNKKGLQTNVDASSKKEENSPEDVSEEGKASVDTGESSFSIHPPVGVAFTKMLNFYNSFLLAISTFGLYIIDPSNSTVLLWVSEPDGITDIKVSGNTLIYKTGKGFIQNFMITTVDVAILVLHNRSLMIECARLCLQNQELFVTSKLLCRLGTKIIADLMGQILDETVQGRLKNLEKYINQNQNKESLGEANPKKSGITYVRNDRYNSSEIKEGLNFALRLRHHAYLPPSVTRCCSEPHLRYDPEESSLAQRTAVSVETSPIHEQKGDRLLSGTSNFMQDLQSSLSLANYSSEDTLRSVSTVKSHSGCSSHSDGSDRKSSSPEPSYSKTLNSPAQSSGRWSQQSDKSQKSLESSQEMYEDPLFPPSDSSPELEMATRMYLDGRRRTGNPYESRALYNIPYAPINPSSETAAIVQDLMENAATNVVSTITMGTKSLKEKLRKGPFSVLDVHGNGSNTDQDDPLQSSTSGTDETDGFDMDIVIKTKPKKKGNRKSTGTSPVLSRSATLPEVDDILRPNMELPGVVRNLHELVMSTMKQITSTENKQETTDLLTQWFDVYCSTVQQIQLNKNSPQPSEEPPDGPVSISSVDSSFSIGSAGTSCDSLKWDSNDIGFEPSAMSADILQQITQMFLHCMQSRVYTSGTNNRQVSACYRTDVTQHPLTPEDVKKLDSLYAQLITNDCGLLHYSTLLNALDILGQNYYLLTWMALLEKVTKDSEISSSYPLPDIISDLDFTRSQQVAFLFKLASGGNMKNFIYAATQIQNPYVILDVIYMLNYTLPRSNEPGTLVNKTNTGKYYLLQYLNEVAQEKDIRELYLAYWSWCPELQFDILNALLSALNPATVTCGCGMPSPCRWRIPLENLVETLLAHHILDPKNMLQLCQSLGFWKGYCIISMAYKLQPVSDCFPYVLQGCDLDLIEIAMEYLDPTEFSVAFNALITVTSTNNSVIKCYKCQNILNLVGNIPIENEPGNSGIKVRVNGEPCYKDISSVDVNNRADKQHSNNLSEPFEDTLHQHKESRSSTSMDAQISSSSKIVVNVGQLWEAVVVQVLRRTKATDTLKLLQSVQDEIPPGILPQKLYSWCILLSLVENKGPTVRWALLDSLTHTNIKTYSNKVAEAIRRTEPSSRRQGSTTAASMLKNDPKELSPKSYKDAERAFSPVGHHWGVRSQVLQGTCQFCQLRLPEKALVSVGGITVFPCSHAYHAICLAQRGYYCIVCAKRESQKALKVAGGKGPLL